MIFSGTSPEGQLVEVLELADHPWFLAVQCHPEFKSKPTQAHPIFRAFVQASLARREQQKKVAEPGRPIAKAATAASAS
jgi:CTP synthase